MTFIEEMLKRGTVRCGECNRLGTIRKRHLHAAQCRSLLRLYRLDIISDGGWFHTRAFAGARSEKASSDVAYMTHWGLVTSNHKEQGKGMYAITPRGRAFIRGSERVPGWIAIFNNAPIAVAPIEEWTYIHQVRHFDETLIAAYRNPS